ncbi:AraC family transcriptional regulator [Hyphomicrobium sp.]|uniref:helix-turn-helix domain-containing protein n=1 Tax=Hyphomicrobium sp. TaxID=82 RepID=UPI001E0AC923|nr:AraC family transcriptional regulator [Hyphomicrobium sp.]MBY0558932.1 AraC family transcriptional regulator [Hyphomicrobium sp.]
MIHLMKTEIDGGCQSGSSYPESLDIPLVAYPQKHYSVGLAATKKGQLSGAARNLLVEYIISHLDGDLSLTKLGQLINRSPYDLCRLFKNTMGTSPHQFIINSRIAKCKILLAAGRLSLAEISFRTGFTDQSHLSRVFRASTGMTPGRYRQSYCKKKTS